MYTNPYKAPFSWRIGDGCHCLHIWDILLAYTLDSYRYYQGLLYIDSTYSFMSWGQVKSGNSFLISPMISDIGEEPDAPAKRVLI